jgi:hypothetical protein
MIRWLRNVWHKAKYGTCVECPFYRLHAQYLEEEHEIQELLAAYRARQSAVPARESLCTQSGQDQSARRLG